MILTAEDDDKDRTEHQNTPRTSKIDRVARIAAGYDPTCPICNPATDEAKRMAQMALDEFTAAYWRKS